MDIAVVSAACFIILDQEKLIKELNISLGAVAPIVVNVTGINELVINNNLNDDLLSQISIICSNSCDPIDDKRGTIEFRSHVAGVLAKRAIILAHSRAGDKIEKSFKTISFDESLLKQSSFWLKSVTWTLIGTSSFAVLWLSFAKTDEVVIALGKLEPKGDVKDIQIPIGGVIEAVSYTHLTLPTKRIV